MKVFYCIVLTSVFFIISGSYPILLAEGGEGVYTDNIDQESERQQPKRGDRVLEEVTPADTCIDPLSLPWVDRLINNPFDPYCSECLKLFQAKWKGDDVLIYEWDAGSCGFTDLGFATIYNCNGDTLQHCNVTIAGLICDPDAGIQEDSLKDKELIWQCVPRSFPECHSDLLALAWVNDSLEAYEHLCGAICIEGNSGNYLYKHMVDTNVIIELRTTCGDIIRRFFDCAGDELFRCFHFDFALTSDCDLPFLPSVDDGELLWDCPTTSIQSELPNKKMLSFWPSVITDQLIVSTELPQIWHLTIYNAFGQAIESLTIRSDVEIISTSHWPRGTLFIKIRSENVSEFVKLIKVE